MKRDRAGDRPGSGGRGGVAVVVVEVVEVVVVDETRQRQGT
jgi:hypothetical protein